MLRLQDSAADDHVQVYSHRNGVFDFKSDKNTEKQPYVFLFPHQTAYYLLILPEGLIQDSLELINATVCYRQITTDLNLSYSMNLASFC